MERHLVSMLPTTWWKGQGVSMGDYTWLAIRQPPRCSLIAPLQQGRVKKQDKKAHGTR